MFNQINSHSRYVTEINILYDQYCIYYVIRQKKTVSYRKTGNDIISRLIQRWIQMFPLETRSNFQPRQECVDCNTRPKTEFLATPEWTKWQNFLHFMYLCGALKNHYTLDSQTVQEHGSFVDIQMIVTMLNIVAGEWKNQSSFWQKHSLFYSLARQAWKMQYFCLNLAEEAENV